MLASVSACSSVGSGDEGVVAKSRKRIGLLSTVRGEQAKARGLVCWADWVAVKGMVCT